MSENLNKNFNCGRAEQLVSYLYGEIAPRERETFEAHLQSCPNCPTEIAAFQEMRFTFGEWREAGEVPRFVAHSQLQSVAQNSGTSWSDWLRSFALSPARSFAAAVILISIFAGLYFFSLNRAASPEISQDVSATENTAQNESANVTNETPVNIEKSPTSEPDAAAPQNTPVIAATTAGEKQSPNQKSTVKTSTASKPKVRVKTDVRQNNNQTAGNERPTNRKNVPRILTVDEEDRSLRLADIFDEVSMK